MFVALCLFVITSAASLSNNVMRLLKDLEGDCFNEYRDQPEVFERQGTLMTVRCSTSREDLAAFLWFCETAAVGNSNIRLFATPKSRTMWKVQYCAYVIVLYLLLETELFRPAPDSLCSICFQFIKCDTACLHSVSSPPLLQLIKGSHPHLRDGEHITIPMMPSKTFMYNMAADRLEVSCDGCLLSYFNEAIIALTHCGG